MTKPKIEYKLQCICCDKPVVRKIQNHIKTYVCPNCELRQSIIDAEENWNTNYWQLSGRLFMRDA